MADNLRKFTTQEVLNKVYTDSSGITIGLNSQSSKETLNAVLDSSNNRLQVAMAGGTISGDVTISGDLTVEGDNVLNISETIQGKLKVVEGAGTLPSGIDTTTGDLIIAQNNDTTTDIAAIYAIAGNAGSSHYVFGDADSKNPGRVSYDHSDNSMDLVTNSAVRMTVTSTGSVQITQTAVSADSGTNAHIKLNGAQAYNHASNFVTITGNTIYHSNGSSARHTILRAGKENTTDNNYAMFTAFYSRAHGSHAAERMRITSAGNVGVGIDSPGEKLAVADGNIEAIMTTAGSGLRMIVDRVDTSDFAGFEARTGGSQKWFIGLRETSDDDLHFYDPNGTAGDRLVLDTNSRISLSNNDSGTSNTIFGKNAGVNLVSNSAYNIAIGELALNAYKGDDGNNSGTKNIAIGISAMEAFQGGDGDVHANTRFDRNIALGYNSFRGTDFNNAEVVVTDNIAIGDEALNSTGANGQVGTIAIGSNALTALTTGVLNTAIGHDAGKLMTNNNNNVIVGYAAFDAADSGESNNVVIGQSAGGAIDNAQADNNVIIGNSAGTGGDGTMVGCIYIGAEAGGATHSRNQNDNVFIGKDVAKVAWGGQCDDNVGIGSGVMSTGALNDAHGNVALGYLAMEALTQSDNNVAIGKEALKSITSGSGGNVAIGYLSGRDVTGTSNIFIGQSAGMQQTSGSGSVNIGHEAGKVDSSSANVIIGHLAFSASNTSNSSSNVIVGYESGVEINHADSTDNVIIGRGAGRGGAGEFTNNIAIGSYALDGTTTNDISGTIAIGHYALTAVTSGTQNTAVGYQAGAELQDNHANTVIGYQAMYRSGATTYHNVYIGNLAGDGDWTGACHSNTAVGSSVMRGAMTITAVNNVAMGRDALAALTSGHSNVAIGKSAGDSITTMAETTLVGYSAGGALTTGTGQNVAIGSEALSSATSVQFTTAVGYKALQGISAAAADDNQTTGIGWAAGYNITTGLRNTAIGAQALLDNQTGNNNTAVGQLALENTTGAESVGVGKGAGQTNTSGINNTFVGTDADSSGNFNYQTALGWNAETECSNQTVIGFQSVFKFQSQEYSCVNGSADDGDIASTTAPLKIPSHSVIKSVSAILTQISDVSTYNLMVVYSDNSSAPSDDSALTNPVELIGAGAATSKSGGSGNASDIEGGTSGHAVKASFYNGFDGNGLHVGTSDRYIHIANAAGNADTDMSTVAKIKVLVEYVGLD
jgi:hypothetical protein